MIFIMKARRYVSETGHLWPPVQHWHTRYTSLPSPTIEYWPWPFTSFSFYFLVWQLYILPEYNRVVYLFGQQLTFVVLQQFSTIARCLRPHVPQLSTIAGTHSNVNDESEKICHMCSTSLLSYWLVFDKLVDSHNIFLLRDRNYSILAYLSPFHIGSRGFQFRLSSITPLPI